MAVGPASSFVFIEGEDSLAVTRAALQDVAPTDDDMAPGAPPSSTVPPIADHHRMAPPLGYADQVYRQKNKGTFERVGGFGASSGAGAGVRRAGSDALGNLGSAAAQPSRSNSFGGGPSQLGGGEGATEGPSYQIPLPVELQVASALYHLVVAPTRFVAGVLAGLAAIEALLLAALDVDFGQVRASCFTSCSLRLGWPAPRMAC